MAPTLPTGDKSSLQTQSPTYTHEDLKKLDSPTSAQPPYYPDLDPYLALQMVDNVSRTIPLSSGQGRLLILEDNDAVLTMHRKSRAPLLRHVTRTHRVNLDWCLERLREDEGIYLRYINKYKTTNCRYPNQRIIQHSSMGSINLACEPRNLRIRSKKTTTPSAHITYT